MSLLSAFTQRWRDRRDTYLPAGEVINTAEYEVAEIPDDTTAKAFVERHHYAKSYPAARFRYGIFHRRTGLCGVAVFSHPCNDKTLTNVFPCTATEATELGRFVLLDDVGANAETWMLARCFEQLKREGIAGVVSFSDDTPRTTAAGRTVFAGHIGTIYQAFNATYLGRGTARTLKLLPDATVLSDRAISKLLTLDRGWRGVAGLLMEYGAGSPPGSDEAVRAWANLWIKKLTRPLKHPGNHRYAWAIEKGMRKHLAAKGPQPYPKKSPILAAVI